MRELTTLFKALSDETRLQMLGLLCRRGELCVCDFVEVLEISQSKASRHLRHLVNAGLLEDRREGVWVYFRVADPSGQPIRDVLRLLPKLVGERVSSELEARLDRWLKRKAKGASCRG